MEIRSLLKNYLIALLRLIKYNMKIIFANKFLYFLIGAVAIFILITLVNLLVLDSANDEETVFGLLLVPGILVLFYPMTFGIQNDADNRMLEIIFGIPNYRYKVQFFRFVLVLFLTFAILLIFAVLSVLTITPMSITEMLYQLMFPILFIGSFAFLVSSLVKDGSGTAVIMIIFGLFFFIAGDFFQDNPKWNVFLNPFALPQNFNEMVWQEIIVQNRIYLIAGSLFSLLLGLLNLQKRERLL